MLKQLRLTGKWLGHAGRMLVGIPDYDNYVRHRQTRHPGEPIMSYKAFFRERQQARYGGDGKNGMRCC